MAEATRITLPSGAWADLRDPEDITERQARLMRSAQMGLFRDSPALAQWAKSNAGNTPDEASVGDILTVLDDAAIAASFRANDAMIAALVASWSFDLPIDMESVQDIPGRDYAALQEAVAEHGRELIVGPKEDPRDPLSPPES